jgi:hypothetical protein
MQETIPLTEERDHQPTTDPLGTPPIVESDLAESVVTSTEPPVEPDISKHPTVPLAQLEPPIPTKRYFQVNWWSVVAIALSLVLIGEHLTPLLWPLIDGYFHPKATVTLFPTQKTVSETYTFLAVTGTADQARGQIPSRLLTFTTPTKTAAIQTTGVGYTPAIKARGQITFYNEAPYVQTIQAGTVINGTTGIQIVTDQTVSIAEGNGITNGSATVVAHTIQAGARSNIQPLDINGLCCLAGIYAKNTSSFTGGLDPKPFPMLSPADLQRVAQTSAGTLSSNANAGIQHQMQKGEQLLRPMQCSVHTSSNPQVGERATTAIVSVSETCTAQVYDNAVLTQITSVQFQQESLKQLGSNFVARGNTSTVIEKTTLLDKSHSTYQLTVNTSGVMVFHLSPTQLQALKMQIAGKRIADAQHELLQLTGVAGVYIKPSSQNDTTLPADPGRIQVIVA